MSARRVSPMCSAAGPTFWAMRGNKKPGDTWSLSDVVRASGRSRNSVNMLARKLLPPELLEPRAGRGAAVQLPEWVALALVDTLRLGALDPQMIEALKTDRAAVLAAADGLAQLVRLLDGTTQSEAA